MDRVNKEEHYKGCIECFLFELGDLDVSQEVREIIERRLIAGLQIGEGQDNGKKKQLKFAIDATRHLNK